MPEEREYATETDLGPDDAFNEVHLPVLGKWVTVRILSTPEITELTYLPDLVGFGKLAQQLRDEPAELDSGKFIVEQMRYLARLAHIAVVRDKEGAMSRCQECGLEHTPPLWTVKQAGRLQHADLNVISEAAVGVQALMRLRPFSKDRTPEGSPAPASSGE